MPSVAKIPQVRERGPEITTLRLVAAARLAGRDPEEATDCAIKAWYKPGEGIILDESLHPETNMFDRSILLHELVHYVQDMSGYYGNADPCNRWFHRELNAYEIQNRYLGAIGHPSRVAYAGNNCHAMDAMMQDGITRRQVFSGATRHPDTED